MRSSRLPPRRSKAMRGRSSFCRLMTSGMCMAVAASSFWRSCGARTDAYSHAVHQSHRAAMLRVRGRVEVEGLIPQQPPYGLARVVEPGEVVHGGDANRLVLGAHRFRPPAFAHQEKTVVLPPWR